MSHYEITLYTVKIKGQRKRYMWVTEHITPETANFVECGDSFYVFNAKRAAKRAASRHAHGLTEVEVKSVKDFFV